MIDLCVVSYNTKPLLKRFLNTLYKGDHSTKIYDLLIADNGSTDGSAQWLDANKKLLSDTYAIMLNENIGYSAACNQLAAMGTGDIIGLLNADVWLTVQDVRSIQKSFDDHPEQAIMGPKQRDENGYVRHGGIIGTNTKPQHRGWNDYDPKDLKYRDRIECVSISGSAYFIRREVWEALTECSVYKEAVMKQNNEVTGAFLPTPHYY
jgi:GT2 family glycosyltransferase